jgi:hypothetical protein
VAEGGSLSHAKLDRKDINNNITPNRKLKGTVSSKRTAAVTTVQGVDDDAEAKADKNVSGTGWVGLQAITAFFVIIAAVAFALFLRPTTNRSNYDPL